MTDHRTPDDEARAKLLSRIRKMLAMADDKRGDPNEIATAAEQAARLMRKFNIEYADVIAAELKSGHGVIEADIAAANYDKEIPHWYNVLATIAGRTLDCQCRLVWVAQPAPDYGHKLAFRLYGYKSDVEVAQWLFAYLFGQIQSLADTYWKARMAEFRAAGRNITPPLRRKVKDRYREGVVNGINARVREVYGKADEQAETVAQAASSNALVVVKQQAITDAFPTLDFTYGDPKKHNPKADLSAYWKGVSDAAKVRVERVIESDAAEPEAEPETPAIPLPA